MLRPMLVGHPEDGIPRRLLVMAVNTLFFMAGGLIVAAVLGSVGWLLAIAIGPPYDTAYAYVLVLYGLKSGARSLGLARHSDFVRSIWQAVRESVTEPTADTAEPTDEEVEEALEDLAKLATEAKRGFVKLALAMAYATVFFSVCAGVIAGGQLLGHAGLGFIAGVVLFVIEVEALERYGVAPIGTIMDTLWVAAIGDENILRLADLPLIGRRQPA